MVRRVSFIVRDVAFLSYNAEHMKKGLFIVLEGGDGSGKDTQVALLQKELAAEYLFVRDPGSTEIGTKIREIVLHDERVAYQTELLMYLAARVQLAEECIKPALEKGTHVISQRFDLSTIAYQIYGRERHDLLAFVKDMSAYALGGLVPDLLIFLDCSPEEGIRRVHAMEAAPDRFEREHIAFHERVYEGYKQHLNDYPHHIVVDARKPKGDVYQDVLQAIQQVTQ